MLSAGKAVICPVLGSLGNRDGEGESVGEGSQDQHLGKRREGGKAGGRVEVPRNLSGHFP